MKFFIWISRAIVFLLCHIVFAAGINYVAPVTISLSSPAINFTIASGSVADSLTVNATSVVIGMSSSTNGSFTLISSASDLSISAGAGGGMDPTSCTSGVASTTISQSSGSALYTITPTGSPCSSSGGNSSSSPSASGPIVGVASAYGLPNYGTSNPTSSSTLASTASLEATIASLEAELQSLLALAHGQGIPAAAYGVFLRNLSLWSEGSDVQSLQEFLIQKNAGPAARILAAHGTTEVFGYITFRALKEYQTSVGLPATGFFGPLTRQHLL